MLRVTLVALLLVALVVATGCGGGSSTPVTQSANQSPPPITTVWPTAAPGAYTNLVQNAGIENPLGSEWYADPSLSKQGLAYRSQLVVHTGKYSLKLVPTKDNSTGDPFQTDFGVSQQLSATPYLGKPLYFAAWMSAKDGATAVLQLVGLTSDKKIYLRELRRETTTSEDMILKQDVLDVPNDPKLIALFLVCSVKGGTGTVSFDDLVVSPDHPGTTWKLGQYDPGPPLEATVQVHTNQLIRRIPRTIYGLNLEWIANGQGLWDDTQEQLNPNLMQLVGDLGAALWRFPGGLYADYYHWANGIGPQALRPTISPGPIGQPGKNTFGTDELMGLAAGLNSQATITVNPLTGTAQEAAGWVSYVNNGTRRVDYWEVGNELYLQFPVGNDLSGPVFEISPQEYAQDFLEFAAAMRVADPSIKIGADMEFNYPRSVPRLHPDWLKVVLQQAGSQIDFVSVHNGFSPALAYDGGWDVRSVYSAMLASPLLVQRSLHELSDAIDANAGPNAPHIRIAVSEWGPFFDTNAQDRFIDHVKTLASALYTASLLKVLIEDPRTDTASGFKLVDGATQGWIGIRQGAFVPKAPYYALQMFTQHFGPLAVKTSVTSPVYQTRSIGWAEAVESAPFLDVVSSVDDAHQTVYLIAVNKHFDRAIHASISLDSFVAGSAKVWTLTGTGIDANTGTELPAGLFATQAVAVPDGRFNLGGPGEISVTSADLQVSGQSFDYQFPARSVTAIVLSGRATP